MSKPVNTLIEFTIVKFAITLDECSFAMTTFSSFREKPTIVGASSLGYFWGRYVSFNTASHKWIFTFQPTPRHGLDSQNPGEF